MGYDYMCERCKRPMHLGACGSESQLGGRVVTDEALANFKADMADCFTIHRNRADATFFVVDIGGQTAAYGFDTYSEAEAWIKDQEQ